MASSYEGLGAFTSSTYHHHAGDVSFSSGYSYPNYSGSYYNPMSYLPANQVSGVYPGSNGIGVGTGIGAAITSGTIGWPSPNIQRYEESYDERRKSYFYSMMLRGALKQSIEPMFDTLKIRPGERITDHIAFIIPRGQHQKSGADTNMNIGGQLGTPVQAAWHQIRVHLERYTGIEDAIRWRENASIELVVNSRSIWQGSIGSMLPILPKGGYNKIDEKIKTGVIRFWPWYEAELEQTLIESTDTFSVRLTYKEPVNPAYLMSIKISLGPYLYRPVM